MVEVAPVVVTHPAGATGTGPAITPRSSAFVGTVNVWGSGVFALRHSSAQKKNVLNLFSGW